MTEYVPGGTRLSDRLIEALLNVLCWRSDREEARLEAAVAADMAERYDLVLFEGEWLAVEKPGYWEKVRSD